MSKSAVVRALVQVWQALRVVDARHAKAFADDLRLTGELACGGPLCALGEYNLRDKPLAVRQAAATARTTLRRVESELAEVLLTIEAASLPHPHAHGAPQTEAPPAALSPRAVSGRKFKSGKVLRVLEQGRMAAQLDLAPQPIALPPSAGPRLLPAKGETGR